VWTTLGANALARRVILILDEPPNRQMTVSKFGPPRECPAEQRDVEGNEEPQTEISRFHADSKNPGPRTLCTSSAAPITRCARLSTSVPGSLAVLAVWRFTLWNRPRSALSCEILFPNGTSRVDGKTERASWALRKWSTRVTGDAA
jgi:hypothetical protein